MRTQAGPGRWGGGGGGRGWCLGTGSPAFLRDSGVGGGKGGGGGCGGGGGVCSGVGEWVGQGLAVFVLFAR